MLAQPGLTQVERDKLEIDPELELSETRDILAKNVPRKKKGGGGKKKQLNQSMSKFLIEGGHHLSGDIPPQGAKNEA